MITGGSGLLGMSLTRRLVSLGMSVSSTYYTRMPPQNLKQYFYQYDFEAEQSVILFYHEEHDCKKN